jgi:hypothetical protein
MSQNFDTYDAFVDWLKNSTAFSSGGRPDGFQLHHLIPGTLRN